MPANLTQQYHKAEAAYRRAASPEEELECLQEMLRELPKHKGTDKLQAELKQKISKAKKDAQTAKSQKKGPSFRIPRQGAGRVAVIGGPNCGKSRLVGELTRANPPVAPYPFTTRELSPGMMPWEDVMVQLIDTPPITADVFDPNVLSVVRGADLVLLLVDMGSDDGIEQLQEVLDQFAESKTGLGVETYLDENDIGKAYTKTFLVFNKMDDAEAETRLELLREFVTTEFVELQISAEQPRGLDELKRAVYESLDVVRVYTKMPNKKEADYDRPFTVPRGGTLLDVAQLIHKDFAENFKHARVWGSEVHDGTTVKGDYVLHDKDVVELHI